MWQALWNYRRVAAYVILAVAVVGSAAWVLFFTPRSLTLLAVLVLVLATGVGVAASKLPAKHKRLSKSLGAAAVVASLGFAWAQVARPDDAPAAEGAVAGDSAGSPSPSETAVPSATASSPAARRTLLNWVSDVNRTCAPIIPKVKAEKARHGASQSEEVGIASLENTQDLIKPIVRDITTVIELPSDRDDQARAEDWINSYREFYARFVDANRKLRDYAEATGLERILTASKAKSAMQAVMDAATATKSQGDALGIVCPAVSSTG